MWLRVSVIIFQLFQLTMLEKCVLTILELNWNQRLVYKKTKLNVCHHMLTSSTQLQNRSFHVVESTRTSSKCQKMKDTRAKRAKILLFIVKYANLWGFCCRRRRGCLSSVLIPKRFQRVLMGVPIYQLTTNFSANCQLTTIFLANCQLTVNPISTLKNGTVASFRKRWKAIHVKLL